MSSLRVATLRLVWLEVFLDVVETENLSATARNFGVDQSTVSRHLQALQNWLGKDLIEISKIIDPDSAGRNVEVTAEGRAFTDIANEIVERLTGFRTPRARSTDLIESMAKLAGVMLADLNSKKPSNAALNLREKIEAQCDDISRFNALLRDYPAAFPYEYVSGLAKDQRRFFATYEDQLKRERRLGKRSKPKRYNGPLP